MHALQLVQFHRSGRVLFEVQPCWIDAVFFSMRAIYLCTPLLLCHYSTAMFLAVHLTEIWLKFHCTYCWSKQTNQQTRLFGTGQTEANSVSHRGCNGLQRCVGKIMCFLKTKTCRHTQAWNKNININRKFAYYDPFIPFLSFTIFYPSQ